MTDLHEVMTRGPVETGPDATVAEAAGTMVRERVGSLLVSDGGSVVGILTERDVLRAAGADGDLLATRVRDWMTQEPTTAPTDQDTEEALATMLEGGFRHLPVTEDGEVVGIVSLRDLLRTRLPGDAVAAGTQDAETSDSPDPAPESSPTTVQERRERMFEATRMLQRRSRPPQGDEAAWRDRLGEAIDLIDEVVAAHVADTESDGGFFDELLQESGGRLSAAVRRLRRDHERSTEMIAELRASMDADTNPARLSQAADELFAQLEAHRHRGADLLWQAYGQEIGGGD